MKYNKESQIFHTNSTIDTLYKHNIVWKKLATICDSTYVKQMQVKLTYDGRGQDYGYIGAGEGKTQETGRGHKMVGGSAAR